MRSDNNHSHLDTNLTDDIVLYLMMRGLKVGRYHMGIRGVAEQSRYRPCLRRLAENSCSRKVTIR